MQSTSLEHKCKSSKCARCQLGFSFDLSVDLIKYKIENAKDIITGILNLINQFFVKAYYYLF